MGIPLSFHPNVRGRGGDDGHGHDGRDGLDDDHHVYVCEVFQLPQAPMYSHVHAHVHAHVHGHDRGCVHDHDGDDHDRGHDGDDRDRGHDYVSVCHSVFSLPHDPE